MSELEKTSAQPVDLATPDPTDEVRTQLRELGLVDSEGNVDREGLLMALGLEGTGEADRYRFSWAGQSESVKVAREPALQALTPVPTESVDFNDTRNVVLAGDNLEVLKLLAPAYRDRVKCIYIDPPYNTGADKVYRDNFHDALAAYLQQTGQVAANGDALTTNLEKSGRYHSAWLSMMFPRLWWARQLLSDDGVLFCSIDDHEQNHLRLLLDQIFGFENFIAAFVWVKKKKGSHLSQSHRSMTEYVLAYGKNKSLVGDLYGEDAYKNKPQPLVKRTNAVNTLTFEAGTVRTTLPDGHYEAGLQGEHPADNGTGGIFAPFKVEGGIVTTPLTVEARFVWSQSFLDEEVEKGSQITLSKQFGFNAYRHDEEGKFKRPTTLLGPDAEVGTNEDAYAELDELLGVKGLIDYPKPVSLVKYLVRAVTYFHPDALVLDFFAGSGTTAQAVMELNAELGGRRRFILVQLPEKPDEDSPAHKAGFTDLAQFCRERVRRAGAMIGKGDTDFRAFTQAHSSFTKPRVAAEKAPETTEELLVELEQAAEPLAEGWESDCVIWEIAEKHGWPLDSQVNTFDLEGNTFTQLQPPQEGEEPGPLLVCCLDDNLREEAVAGLLTRDPSIELFVCRDSALTDSQAANLGLQLRVRTI